MSSPIISSSPSGWVVDEVRRCPVSSLELGAARAFGRSDLGRIVLAEPAVVVGATTARCQEISIGRRLIVRRLNQFDLQVALLTQKATSRHGFDARPSLQR